MTHKARKIVKLKMLLLLTFCIILYRSELNILPSDNFITMNKVQLIKTVFYIMESLFNQNFVVPDKRKRYNYDRC